MKDKIERIRIANRYESEGRVGRLRILGQMTKDLEAIESEGWCIRGQADAEVLSLCSLPKIPNSMVPSRSLNSY